MTPPLPEYIILNFEQVDFGILQRGKNEPIAISWDPGHRCHVAISATTPEVYYKVDLLCDGSGFCTCQLLAQLAGTDIVISPRYHNIILSLMLKKRAISLSYNEKFEALMHGFELDTYSLRLDELDVNRLIEQLISIEREGDRLSASIGKRTDEYRRALNDQYETVFARWGR